MCSYTSQLPNKRKIDIRNLLINQLSPYELLCVLIEKHIYYYNFYSLKVFEHSSLLFIQLCMTCYKYSVASVLFEFLDKPEYEDTS